MRPRQKKEVKIKRHYENHNDLVGITLILHDDKTEESETFSDFKSMLNWMWKRSINLSETGISYNGNEVENPFTEKWERIMFTDFELAKSFLENDLYWRLVPMRIDNIEYWAAEKKMPLWTYIYKKHPAILDQFHAYINETYQVGDTFTYMKKNKGRVWRISELTYNDIGELFITIQSGKDSFPIYWKDAHVLLIRYPLSR